MKIAFRIPLKWKSARRMIRPIWGLLHPCMLSMFSTIFQPYRNIYRSIVCVQVISSILETNFGNTLRFGTIWLKWKMSLTAATFMSERTSKSEILHYYNFLFICVRFQNICNSFKTEEKFDEGGRQ